MIVCALLVAGASVAAFAVGHAGPSSKLKAVQDEIENAEGAVSAEAKKLIAKIKGIL